MKKRKLEKYSREWSDEKKKTCKWCLNTSYYCLRHAPRTIMKTSRTWGGMSHSEKCKFYQSLVGKDAIAVVRYCAIVQVDFCEDPDFKGWAMECPDCIGYDSRIQKN